MEFNEKLIKADIEIVENNNVHLKSTDGTELVMHIGDPVTNAVWAEHGKLLVTLENGTIRLYHNQLDYDMI
ncbi:hypothetical protein [Flavobacterium sp. JP2137]|uniref:hypothetical protein n=1 Tax=Flavobacterium sp. JP2137 TaxID=3414510 RepID=UPI003D2F9F12